MEKLLLHNTHVGEILKTEFINAFGMSQNALAKAINVPSNRIHEIVRGERKITADTDLRLCKFFGLSEGYFLRMQVTCETIEAKRKLKNELCSIPLVHQYVKTKGLPHGIATHI